MSEKMIDPNELGEKDEVKKGFIAEDENGVKCEPSVGIAGVHNCDENDNEESSDNENYNAHESEDECESEDDSPDLQSGHETVENTNDDAVAIDQLLLMLEGLSSILSTLISCFVGSNTS